MAKARVVETDGGIQESYIVEIYDQMQRRFRDKGWMETEAIIKCGIDKGTVLEYGPGPGYLGLEWLKRTTNTHLKAVDISLNMIDLSVKNSSEYGFSARTEYILSDGKSIPFPDDTFDGLFSNGSLHEWSKPVEVISEFYRVLKPGGKFFISDLRRDMPPFIKWFMWLATKPKQIRPGLLTSIAAAYIVDEVRKLLTGSQFNRFEVRQNLMGLSIAGQK